MMHHPRVEAHESWFRASGDWKRHGNRPPARQRSSIDPVAIAQETQEVLSQRP
jgi:hypothetical protein